MIKEYDVVVIGSGPGGISAALACAEEGAKTLLIERYGFLGGMATAGLVNPFMSYKLKGRKLTSQIFNELINQMEAKGALDKKERIFDDEIMKFVLDEMTHDYGVDILLHSLFVAPELNGNHIDAIYTEGKSGRLKIGGKIFIDATGDGDLSSMAGVSYEYGRKEDGLCQPVTLCFRLGGIDPHLSKSELSAELNQIFDIAKENDEITQPRENVLIFATLHPGVWHFNTTRIVGINPLDPEGLTYSEVEGRRQIQELFQLFRKHSKACKNAYIQKIACQIGVRESRRIIGHYLLTEDDITTAQKFEDGIARTAYNIDIHNPAGSGTFFKHVPEGDYYEIPYRSIVPNGIDNLLLASRCISSTHEAHASLRIMPVVSGIGEAAGRAAAWAVASKESPINIDSKALKDKMLINN